MRDTYTLKQTPQLAERLQVMDTHIDSDKVPVKGKKKILSQARQRLLMLPFLKTQ